MAKTAVKHKTSRQRRRQTGPGKPTVYRIRAKVLVSGVSANKALLTARPQCRWGKETSMQLQFVFTGGNLKDFGFQKLSLEDSKYHQGDRVHLLRQCTVCNDKTCYCKILKWCPQNTVIGGEFVNIAEILCSEGFMPLAGKQQLIVDDIIEILTNEGEQEVKMDGAEVKINVLEGRRACVFTGFEVAIVEK